MSERDTIRCMYQLGIAAMLSRIGIVPGGSAARLSGGQR